MTTKEVIVEINISEDLHPRKYSICPVIWDNRKKRKKKKKKIPFLMHIYKHVYIE